MNVPPTDHETIKGYLLGQIPKKEESKVEARLLTDREFYYELSIVEDDLIDQYIGGALSSADQESFESHFVLSQERQQKIRFARALRKRVLATTDQTQRLIEHGILSNSPEPARLVSPPRSSLIFPFRRPLISYVVAVVILMVVGGSLLLLLKYWQAPAASGRVLAIELTSAPATRDGSEVKQFSLTPEVESVRLQLNLPKNEYQSYEVVLRDSSLRTLLISKNLKPQIINNFAALSVDVKADLLSPGDYRIQLSAATSDGRSENIATFAFTVGTN